MIISAYDNSCRKLTQNFDLRIIHLSIEGFFQFFQTFFMVFFLADIFIIFSCYEKSSPIWLHYKNVVTNSAVLFSGRSKGPNTREGRKSRRIDRLTSSPPCWMTINKRVVISFIVSVIQLGRQGLYHLNLSRMALNQL